MATFTILGANGFIGRHLVEHLRSRGHEVLAVSRSNEQIRTQDLGHVLYCIGYTNDFWQHPLETAEAHVCALLPILRNAQFERLTYLSSVRLCDHLTGVVDETNALRLDPLDPRTIYDFSKALGETLVHHCGRTATVARLAAVYDDALDREDFLCRTLRLAMRERHIRLDSSPEMSRDYIHISDACIALEAIALNSQEPIYHVATGVPFTNRQLAEICETELDSRLVFTASTGPSAPPIIDIRRLVRDFSIHPRPPTERLPSILRQLRARSIRAEAR